MHRFGSVLRSVHICCVDGDDVGMAEESTSPDVAVDRSEGFGERLLGGFIDRAHQMPPQLIASLVAEEIALIGGTDVTVLLQDYDQLTLMPLPGRRLQVGLPRNRPAGASHRRPDGGA